MPSYDRVNRTYSSNRPNTLPIKHNNIQAIGKFEYIYKQELKKVKDNEEEKANK